MGVTLEQQRCHHLRRGESSGEPRRDIPPSVMAIPWTHHHRYHLTSRGAESDSDADLPRSLRDRIRDDAVDAD